MSFHYNEVTVTRQSSLFFQSQNVTKGFIPIRSQQFQNIKIKAFDYVTFLHIFNIRKALEQLIERLETPDLSEEVGEVVGAVDLADAFPSSAL